VELLKKRVPQRSLPTVLGNKRPEPWEAEHLTLGIVSLDKAVAVEEGTLAGLQGDLLSS
jgi:hypothetical protein